MSEHTQIRGGAASVGEGVGGQRRTDSQVCGDTPISDLPAGPISELPAVPLSDLPMTAEEASA